MEERLYKKLLNYSESEYYPMHMPGHKRNSKMLSMVNPYQIDITEIKGFDNLHHAEGILAELSKRISKLYGSIASYPLINGSSVGILAGISALTNKGDKILIARNSHKSVYHAIILNELDPYYLYPSIIKNTSLPGGIPPRDVEDMLKEYPDIKLVVVTSPTYEGIVSDIEAIASIVHRRGGLLLVDEAHGAHFGFHHGFPESSIRKGADLVIQSIHKTLPAFTQTAILHCNNVELQNQIKRYLEIYQSTSPSYILLSGIDLCISLLEDHSKVLFEQFYERLKIFYQQSKDLRNLELLKEDIKDQSDIFDFDISKLSILIQNASLSGHQLCERLRNEYLIEMEMEAKNYILGMTSICDTQEGFDRLNKALHCIDQTISSKGLKNNDIYNKILLEKTFIPYEALEQKLEKVELKKSVGRIAATTICLFPPGIPIVVPGERLNEEIIDCIRQAIQESLTVTGLSGDKDKLDVVN